MSLKNNKLPKYYLQYAGLSVQMFFVMGLASWLGLSLDRYWQLRFPWFLSLFSVGATVWTVYLTIKKLLHHTKK